MAVFTPVTDQQLRDWLAGFPVGQLIASCGIRSGIENTNYFVDTSTGRYVLTLFERIRRDELSFYLDLMHHLAGHGIPCPDPVARPDGARFAELAGKPAALVTCLPGAAVEHPDVEHCSAVGDLLARMHLAAVDYPGRTPNPRGLNWWTAVGPRLARLLEPDQARCLLEELAWQQGFARSPIAARLPSGAVHADLFRDNLLFEGHTVGGVIDFYFAGRDHWLYDLAVVCNDWCIDDSTGDFDLPRLDALLTAYSARRPFTDDERAVWQTMLRAAAFRFWLSRLDDHHRPRAAALVSPKDPRQFERILSLRRLSVPALPTDAASKET